MVLLGTFMVSGCRKSATVVVVPLPFRNPCALRQKGNRRKHGSCLTRYWKLALLQSQSHAYMLWIQFLPSNDSGSRILCCPSVKMLPSKHTKVPWCLIEHNVGGDDSLRTIREHPMRKLDPRVSSNVAQTPPLWLAPWFSGWLARTTRDRDHLIGMVIKHSVKCTRSI